MCIERESEARRMDGLPGKLWVDKWPCPQEHHVISKEKCGEIIGSRLQPPAGCIPCGECPNFSKGKKLVKEPERVVHQPDIARRNWPWPVLYALAAASGYCLHALTR